MLICGISCWLKVLSYGSRLEELALESNEDYCCGCLKRTGVEPREELAKEEGWFGWVSRWTWRNVDEMGVALGGAARDLDGVCQLLRWAHTGMVWG